VKLLLIVLAPMLRIILQGNFSIVSNVVFEMLIKMKYHSVISGMYHKHILILNDDS
jgi:hypothetical protein